MLGLALCLRVHEPTQGRMQRVLHSARVLCKLQAPHSHGCHLLPSTHSHAVAIPLSHALASVQAAEAVKRVQAQVDAAPKAQPAPAPSAGESALQY